jgi:hypothetical protein
MNDPDYRGEIRQQRQQQQSGDRQDRGAEGRPREKGGRDR